ncbi:MAG: FlgD immunoglobulin-like domain containing protein, partial [Candidatus Eiseniibacteriota bacterium]
GEVRLEIFDPQGRIVSTLATGPLPAGRHARTWDARDRSGRLAPAGVYLARLSSFPGGAAGMATRRFVVLN